VAVATDVCIRLGHRIRALRQRRGWTQTYLAVHTGLGRAFISDLERGKSRLPAEPVSEEASQPLAPPLQKAAR
jgi:transcriptional regulator with XRE-family HTH domain